MSPASALVAHAERLIAGTRVLLIGNAEGNLAQNLLERGARLVQVLDPDARRVSHAAAHNTERRVSYAQLTESSLRNGSFDCAFVEDLELAPEIGALVRGLAKVVGARGVAFIAASNDEQTSGLLGVEPGEVTLETLEELTQEHFDEVVIWGQSPFTGYAVVSLDLEEPPQPALDNEYLAESADDADYYVAVCGSREAINALPVEEMTIVQLPTKRVLEGGRSAIQQQNRLLTRRVETLQADVQQLRGRADDGEIGRLSRELERRDDWIRELEARAESADARADDAEAERERLRRDMDTKKVSSQELTRLQERLDEAERIAARSQKEAKWAEGRIKTVEDELEDALAKADRLERSSKSSQQAEERVVQAEKETQRLRDQLASRNEENRRLESQLSDKERQLENLHRRVRDAENELEELQEGLHRATDGAETEVDQDVARLEAQLESRAKRLEEVEAQMQKLEVYTRSLVAESKAEKLVQPESLASEESQSRMMAMEKSLAEREADLVAARWTINELEQKLRSRAN